MYLQAVYCCNLNVATTLNEAPPKASIRFISGTFINLRFLVWIFEHCSSDCVSAVANWLIVVIILVILALACAIGISCGLLTARYLTSLLNRLTKSKFIVQWTNSHILFQRNLGQFWSLFSLSSCSFSVSGCSFTCVAVNEVKKNSLWMLTDFSILQTIIVSLTLVCAYTVFPFEVSCTLNAQP